MKKGERMKGRSITETELKKVQMMIDSGMEDCDIAYCMDFSGKTIERIRKGRHILQQRKTATETVNATTIVSVPTQENEGVFISAILANQREIIGLLDELVNAWRG
ncbi:MAG: hypothetical protein DBX40_07595 [Clostridiales bacterium]|nr:MAG: hypothetical protein DBX40_07595 [Clostridiales bacterium]